VYSSKQTGTVVTWPLRGHCTAQSVYNVHLAASLPGYSHHHQQQQQQQYEQERSLVMGYILIHH